VEDMMKKITMKVDLNGRTASFFVQQANTYKCELFLEKNNKKINAKSIMGVLTLTIRKGETILFYAKGKDAKKAAQTLLAILEDRQ
jgi:catabolite repression HPr-like protein